MRHHGMQLLAVPTSKGNAINSVMHDYRPLPLGSSRWYFHPFRVSRRNSVESLAQNAAGLAGTLAYRAATMYPDTPSHKQHWSYLTYFKLACYWFQCNPIYPADSCKDCYSGTKFVWLTAQYLCDCLTCFACLLQRDHAVFDKCCIQYIYLIDLLLPDACVTN